MWNRKPHGKTSTPEGYDVANPEQDDGDRIDPFRSLYGDLVFSSCNDTQTQYANLRAISKRTYDYDEYEADIQL
jgi:hypothetical protein